jgi:hypothetical protein
MVSVPHPSCRLQRYHKLLSAILAETPGDQIDSEFCREADDAISKFALEGKLLGFQAGDGRGPHEHSGWHDFVSPLELAGIPKEVQKRQQYVLVLLSSPSSRAVRQLMLHTSPGQCYL